MTHQAVILAAGRGERLRPYTDTIPKTLLAVSGKPILQHLLDALPEQIREIVCVVGYLQEQVRNYLSEHSGNRMVQHVLQEKVSGTGHAVALCRDIAAEKFLVLHADDIYQRADLEKLLQVEPLALLAWRERDIQENLHSLGELVVDKNGNLEDIREGSREGKDRLLNCGVYLLDRRFFDYPLVPKSQGSNEFGLPQSLMQMVRSGVPVHIIEANFWEPVIDRKAYERLAHSDK
jgi:glucose-1-phosphate thymidylyltransferase